MVRKWFISLLPLPSTSLEPNQFTIHHHCSSQDYYCLHHLYKASSPLPCCYQNPQSTHHQVKASLQICYFFSIISWNQCHRSLIWPPICKTQESELHLHLHALPCLVAVDPRTVIVSPSTSGSRNQCHGSLRQPSICKTQEADLHLWSHVPPRTAWNLAVDMHIVEGCRRLLL